MRVEGRNRHQSKKPRDVDRRLTLKMAKLKMTRTGQTETMTARYTRQCTDTDILSGSYDGPLRGTVHFGALFKMLKLVGGGIG